VLAAELPTTVAARLPDASLDVVRGDALRASVPGAPTALVANLPYNVAVPVVLHLLEAVPSLQRLLVLVQAEVAERIAAVPGSKIYGVPSVKVAWYASAVKAGTVGPNVFWPAPNVDSGLVRLVRREPPPTSATRAEVFAVVDAAFAQRRKTLRAALAGWAGSSVAAEIALRAAGIDPSARGETLDVIAFARLAEHRA
jgi:16S rRNA (adenine1518-N6/adenine1519-N6)-dimethyltransferase